MMEPQQISQSWTVSEVLQKHPAISRVFLKKKTLCLGCYMARFCSLKDVAQIYGLEAETLVSEIRKAITKNTLHHSEEQDMKILKLL